MTDVNNMIVPSSRSASTAGEVPLVAGGGRTSSRDGRTEREDSSNRQWVTEGLLLDERGQDPLARVAVDIEEFARIWIRRIRHVLQRSSQLVERESLLVAAIKRFDDQKTEWRSRTAAKESSMRDQSERLAEAWLEVESERRRYIQESHVKAATGGLGGRPVGVGSTPSAVHPTVAAPTPQPVRQKVPTTLQRQSSNPVQPHAPKTVQPQVQPTVHGANAATPAPPPVVETTPHQSPLQQSRIGQTAFTHPAGSLSGQMMQPAREMGPVPSKAQNGPGMTGLDALKRAEAATREKIAEFKRMQRAIRSSRNK